MTRLGVLAGLLLLAACHRTQAELTPDADAEARNATAAKTLADIAAAEEASRSPLPAASRPRVAPREAEVAEHPDELPENEAAPPQ